MTDHYSTTKNQLVQRWNRTKNRARGKFISIHIPQHINACKDQWVNQFGLDDELLTKEQLAERLHVPAKWVYEQTRQRAKVRSRNPLPCIHLTPKKLRFNWREVAAWLDRMSEAEKVSVQ